MQEHKQPTYVKSITLRDPTDVDEIKLDMKKHNVVIIRVTPLAQKDIDELKKVVKELYEFTQSIGGDIARLGEERIVLTPPGVKVWKGVSDMK
ncbi:MAG: cell division protein SepF [Thaumarchaeota archaeon]|nr:cell division protein SepF [Nitrososphaerota archaeon]|tara:strand:- start:1226 stop:1504 length:279 start_codon:yes stop_codon:yes gene_type:complete